MSKPRAWINFVAKPFDPNAAMNMKASGTPPEFAKTADIESITFFKRPRTYVTIINAKNAPTTAPIDAVMRANLIETIKE